MRMATHMRKIPALILLSLILLLGPACDLPGGSSDCLPGRDVADWTFTERSPESVTVPVLSCGKTVGWDVSMPAGDHASVIWGVERGFGGLVGDKVSLSVEIDSSGPAATEARATIESAEGKEIGAAVIKPALRGRLDVVNRVSPTDGVIRVVQLFVPPSGSGKWRISNLEWW